MKCFACNGTKSEQNGMNSISLSLITLRSNDKSPPERCLCWHGMGYRLRRENPTHHGPSHTSVVNERKHHSDLRGFAMCNQALERGAIPQLAQNVRMVDTPGRERHGGYQPGAQSKPRYGAQRYRAPRADRCGE